jgi:hypothetical protein
MADLGMDRRGMFVFRPAKGQAHASLSDMPIASREPSASFALSRQITLSALMQSAIDGPADSQVEFKLGSYGLSWAQLVSPGGRRWQ